MRIPTQATNRVKTVATTCMTRARGQPAVAHSRRSCRSHSNRKHEVRTMTTTLSACRCDFRDVSEPDACGFLPRPASAPHALRQILRPGLKYPCKSILLDCTHTASEEACAVRNHRPAMGPLQVQRDQYRRSARAGGRQLRADKLPRCDAGGVPRAL